MNTASIMIVYLICLGVCLICWAGGIVNYVLTALSLYSIADKRNITFAWTAWLPIANYWCVGSIVDYHSSLESKKSNWRKVLITLVIIGTVTVVVSYISLFIVAINMGMKAEYMAEEDIAFVVLGMILPFYLIFIAAVVVIATANICLLVCYYKIFEYLVPEKSVKYLLISSLVPFGLAGCLMKCKNSTVGVFQYAIPAVQPTAPPPDETQNYYTPEQFK